MEYIKAAKENIDIVLEIVQNTVRTIYPKYYPKEVVDFFCELHNTENIAKDIENGNVGILLVDNQIIGTGSCEGNHITRVYVLPQFQKKGYGSFIMQCLEDEISEKYDTVMLDASLPASHLYEKRGYHTIKHEKWVCENNVVLVYEIMEKELTKSVTDVCYDGKRFCPKVNTENGEVLSSERQRIMVRICRWRDKKRLYRWIRGRKWRTGFLLSAYKYIESDSCRKMS